MKDAIRQIIHNYRLLLTVAGGATARFEEPVSGSKADTRAPRDFGSEAGEIVNRVKRLASLTDIQVRSALGGRLNNPADQGHPLRKATRTVVLEEEGKPAAELAFLYAVHQATVERIRREAGRDPSDGTRIEGPRPLTEPPAETLRRKHRERAEATS